LLDSKIRISLKYCGACNPLIDLSKIGKEVKEAIRKNNNLELVSPEDNNIDIMVILCGCPRACGDKAEIRAKANYNVVVAAETIDMVPVPEKDISTAIITKLKSLMDSPKKS
jgi:hypothetical protein